MNGIHVRETATEEFEDDFAEMKGQRSINIQVVFDQKFEITDIIARWQDQWMMFGWCVDINPRDWLKRTSG